MKKGISSGGLVVKTIDNKTHFLFIKFDKYKTIGFAKGHVEKGESLRQAALRETEEETGLSDLRIIKKLGVFKRLSSEGDEMKTIHMYLMKTDNFEHNKADQNYGWFTFDEAIKKMGFVEEKEFLRTIKDKLNL